VRNSESQRAMVVSTTPLERGNFLDSEIILCDIPRIVPAKMDKEGHAWGAVFNALLPRIPRSSLQHGNVSDNAVISYANSKSRR